VNYKDGDNEYLTRTWLIDPNKAEAEVAPTRGVETWNGKDFYVSFGEGEHRNWEDARKYGFVSGGQGKWYSQTLRSLTPGLRVFAYIPGAGYVGVGIVKEAVLPVKEFKVIIEGREVPILDAPLIAPNMADNADDSEISEYLVRIDWKSTIPKSQAYREKGLFAKQHTACRLRNRFTLEKLYKFFTVED